MKTFLTPLDRLAGFDQLKKELSKKSGVINITGCTDAQKPHMIFGCNNGTGGCIIVTFSVQKAEEIVENYRFFNKNVHYFPPKDLLFYRSDLRSNDLSRQRIDSLRAIYEESDPVVVTTADAIMGRLVMPEVFESGILYVKSDDIIDIDVLRKKLVGMGYVSDYQVEKRGQFAIRGGIIDIFPLTDPQPVRIELWGDEVDSIRVFDPETQRSGEVIKDIFIYPACETVLDEKTKTTGLNKIKKESADIYNRLRKEMKTEEAYRLKSRIEELESNLVDFGDTRDAEGFITYFYKKTCSLIDFYLHYAEKAGKTGKVYIDEPRRCSESMVEFHKIFSESAVLRIEKGYMLPLEADIVTSPEILTGIQKKCLTVLLWTIGNPTGGFEYNVRVKSIGSYNGNSVMLIKDLKKYKKDKYATVLMCGSRTRANRMAENLQKEDILAFFTDDPDRVPEAGEIMVVYGKLRKGFEYPDAGFVVLTETDIFGAEKKKKKVKKKSETDLVSRFADLSVGDYVVHENHGLGVYEGIEKIRVEGTAKDYMKIRYADNGVLYVPATQLDIIQKYAGSDAKKVKLNKLNGTEWAKTTTRVRKAVREVADELVQLYAIRQNKKGYKYGADTVWQTEFEEMFTFEETGDQLTAIEAVKADMESDKIMDRLLCGDVGFGKTEVAIRAAFKAVTESKQVVYLVPTTILAQQHYNTFVQRMKDFPVNIELLCRFVTPAKQKKTVENLRKGHTDIVIGTHRVLSKDVTFKDLGLLIIDEEQRFGVTHKEKIKQMKNEVDVLSLSATPIPRTLHMSLIGIRDMSLLEEPPEDRNPIQTYVMEYDEEMIREAITRELARKGQVYYVFNSVRNISDMTDRIQKLVPDATVRYAHGQMNERELENVMYDFINGETDILVSTTIIETGLDISNVNTMIIHDADKLGLSQLYQLRGRIGRSNRTAYAFLLYRRDKMIKEVAEKRLAAIRDFSDLGSGFKIAMKDLEIRGAGTLLGEAQSGHMGAVGYDLYCKMLGEAVSEAKGETQTVRFDTAIDIDVDAFIPEGYITDESRKLDMYKRIASIENEEERDDMLDELIDRFGEPPKSVIRLLDVAMLKSLANKAYFTEVKETPKDIRFTFFEKAQVEPENIPALLEKHRPYLLFKWDKTAPYMVWQKPKKKFETIEVIKEILNSCMETIVSDTKE